MSPPLTDSRVLVVPADGAGARLDAFLARACPDLSRSRLKALIDEGHVFLEGRASKGARKLCGGESIQVRVPPAPASELVPQELPLDVLFEDEHILVLNKPAGLVVHPGAGNPDHTLANALRARMPEVSIGGVLRPGIVHRLDKDTSGVMIVAKSDPAHHELTLAFQERRIDKRYVAFCLGRPRESSFERLTGHRRDDKNRQRFTTRIPAPLATEQGVRRAHSRFVVRRHRAGVAEVEVELLTGRTHQIRAHLADVGHPLLQDALYGGAQSERRLPDGPVRDAVAALDRHALHAVSLQLVHPVTGHPHSWHAALPEDLQRIRRALCEGDPSAWPPG